MNVLEIMALYLEVHRRDGCYGVPSIFGYGRRAWQKRTLKSQFGSAVLVSVIDGVNGRGIGCGQRILPHLSCIRRTMEKTQEAHLPAHG